VACRATTGPPTTCSDRRTAALREAEQALTVSSRCAARREDHPAYTGSDGSYDINVNASDNFTLYIKLLLTDDRGVELEN